MSAYPEHDKMSKIVDKSQAIGSFIDWLDWEKGITLGEVRGFEDAFGRFVPVHESITTLLAQYFEIDLDKIEAEKRAMLAQMRGDIN